ncbi:hydrogenase [Methanobrevibacter sp. OttesenSCG-928-K11]|nr:hydrogenase [Methanobrevibacter sp. OttesenSCG-928-K11]MDL2270912.1 hydrogenase [Methanobrevibacter sp. OttesenSCG-928-I08]
MRFYDKLIGIFKSFKDSTSNTGVSANLTAELTLISTLLMACLLLRHINILLSAVILLGFAVVLLTNMPLIPKFKSEQDDSLNKMLFYVIITLGFIITIMYWGGNFV